MATRAPVYRPLHVAAAERRTDERHRVVVTRATVRGIAQEPSEAMLHDLSIYGCRLGSPVEHAAGETVWLRLNGGVPIAAKVIWNEDGMLGCRFDMPIARSLLRSLTLSLV